MDRRTRYPVEVRERAVRMVFEHGPEYDSQYAAIRSIAEKFGMSPETLRLWVRRAETDEGLRPGLTTDERARMKELEQRASEWYVSQDALDEMRSMLGKGPYYLSQDNEAGRWVPPWRLYLPHTADDLERWVHE